MTEYFLMSSSYQFNERNGFISNNPLSLKEARRYAWLYVHDYNEVAITYYDFRNYVYRRFADVFCGRGDTVVYHGYEGTARGEYGLNENGSLYSLK